jgi:tetratricopeptide (TPR) repeat protein
MRLSTIGAAALFASLSSAGAAAQYAAQPPAARPATPAPSQAGVQPVAKVSKEAAKAIGELQKAVIAKDKAAIPAKLSAAQQAATTNEDRYVIAELQLKMALEASDRDSMAKAVDAIAASGVVEQSRLVGLYSGLGVEFFNAKQYDRAASLFARSIALDPRNVETLVSLAEAQNALGQPAEGSATMQKAIEVKLAAGQKPEEKLYKRALGMAYRANAASAVELGRKWVVAYPSPDSWTNAIAIYRNTAHPDFGATLDLLRVMRAAGALNRPEDFVAYVEAARDQNNFAEAQAVLDEGLAAKKIEPSNPLVAEINAKPKPSLEDLASAAKTAPAGRTLMGIGDRYFGAGEYAKAADTYRQAMAKGADSSLGNLHLGMALARSGDKAGATTALNAVTGANAGIAKYWLLFVQQHG